MTATLNVPLVSSAAASTGPGGDLRERIRRPLGRARRLASRRVNAVRRALHEDPDGNHLVTDPVFILSPVRSGSTLLRAMLNTHTQISAPHEMHLATLRVSTEREYASRSWEALEMTPDDLADILWDRALHRQLVRTGKRVIVDKTPQNAAVWQRIHAFWPQARYVHLRRHPGSILQSVTRATPGTSQATHIRTVVNYGGWLDEARAALPGPTVRYEDLVADPETTLREICGYLGLRYQERMLAYRVGRTRSGLGDWSDNIRSGRVQTARELPTLADVPPALHDLVRSWGY